MCSGNLSNAQLFSIKSKYLLGLKPSSFNSLIPNLFCLEYMTISAFENFSRFFGPGADINTK